MVSKKKVQTRLKLAREIYDTFPSVLLVIITEYLPVNWDKLSCKKGKNILQCEHFLSDKDCDLLTSKCKYDTTTILKKMLDYKFQGQYINKIKELDSLDEFVSRIYNSLLMNCPPGFTIPSLLHSFPLSICYYPSSIQYPHIKFPTSKWSFFIFLSDTELQSRIAFDRFNFTLRLSKGTALLCQNPDDIFYYSKGQEYGGQWIAHLSLI